MYMLSANRLVTLAVLLGDRVEDACEDLSPSAAALLSTIHHHPGIAGSDLARIAGVAQPTAVRVLDSLVRKGLVLRGQKTGRSTPLRTTRAGAARARSLTESRNAAMAPLLESISAPERDRFLSTVETLLAAATTSRSAARHICRHCDHAVCHGEDCPVGSKATALEAADDQLRSRETRP